MAPAKSPLHQQAAQPGESSTRAGDYAASKRIAQAHDAEQGEAIKAQMRAQGLDPETNQPIAPTPRASSPAPAKPFFVPAPVHSAVTGSSGGTVAGAMLGALLFFTGRSYIQGGWSGVRGFYAAKFLNRTSSAPNPVPVAATTPTTPTLPVNTGAATTTTTTPSTTTPSQTPSNGAASTPIGTRLKAGL